MQIHELNQPRKSQVNEVDLVGPGSIFNVGRQVLKNPKAFINSAQLGAAQQAAAQASAAASAQKLANPNAVRRALGNPAYNVGGSLPTTVTLPQALQAVMQNPAVQQQVKNLTAQWQAQAPTVVTAARTRQNISEAIGNPEATKDPAERKLLDMFYQQQAAKAAAAKSGGTGTAPETPEKPVVPTANDKAVVNTQLQDIASAFERWSDPRLSIANVPGVPPITMNQIRDNSAYKQALNDQLTKIAIQSFADPKSPATTQAINTYFNRAIAAMQTEVKNRQASDSTAARPAASTGQAAENDIEVLNLLQQQGISVSRADLQKLGQLLATANNGNYGIRNTGNAMLNAVARLAGMRVGQ